jgi:CheY-like chemotaxis protein
MPTVLIAEDDADNRELLKIVLEMWNYRVIEAKDGVEALNLAEKNFPDLVLMDVKMPFLDGLDATRQIRDSATVSRTPIIIISGCAEAKYSSAASEAGANAVLVKPIDFDKLQSVITEQINFSQTF